MHIKRAVGGRQQGEPYQRELAVCVCATGKKQTQLLVIRGLHGQVLFFISGALPLTPSLRQGDLFPARHSLMGNVDI
jgi:hypothetical protein